MLIAQRFVGLADVRDLAQVERETIRIERRAPLLAFREGAAEELKRVRFLAGIAGALIGDVGRGRRTLEEVDALAVVVRADLQDRTGQPQPVARLARRDRDDLRQGLHSGAEVALRKRRFGLGAQRRNRLRDLTGFGLDLRLQSDGAIG